MITNVFQYLERTAEKYPDKEAFEDKDRVITFSSLLLEAKRIASWIQSINGEKKKMPVAVYLPKGIDCVVSFLAVACSGNFYTPLDIQMPDARIKAILDVLKPFVILTDKNGVEHLKSIEGVPLCIDVSGIHGDGCVQNFNFVDINPLYVMFTSGSTGVPKGVVINHRSVIDYADWLSETFSFSEETIFGNQAPFYFDNSILDIYSTIKNGCKTVIIPENLFLSPTTLLKYLGEKKINTIFWVPTALIMIANTSILENNLLNSLRKVLFCGEPMPCKQLNVWRKNLPNVLYVNMYGPTEITDVCTYYVVDREFQDGDSLPIGKPCSNTEVLVLNEENSLVSCGDIGELCVRGVCLSAGYYAKPDHTMEAFVQNPLEAAYPDIIYRTGDLVYYNEYNELMFVGRKDSQIKHFGHRIELGEIETISISFDGVERCCALYDNEERKIVLVVSPKDIDKKSLYKYLKTRLPGYMCPTRIESLPQLPLNPNGKINRIELKSIFQLR